MFFECQKDNKINFPKIECIEGHCKNNCKLSDETGEEKYNDIWNKKVSYYQFQSVRETYYTKEGVQKFYTRTARKDYRDVPLLKRGSCHVHSHTLFTDIISHST